VNLTNHRIVQSGHLGRSKWPYYHDSSRELKCDICTSWSIVNLDMIIVCSLTLVSILDNYTCKVSGVIACGSKTSISPLLTPVFQFLMPGRKVWAITALTDTFWKQYTNNLKKLEAMRQKKSHVPNSLILVGKINGDEVMFLRVPMFVWDWTLQNVFGMSSDIFGYYCTPMKNPGTLRINMSYL